MGFKDTKNAANSAKIKEPLLLKAEVHSNFHQLIKPI
jgi:hypothetical protein